MIGDLQSIIMFENSFYQEEMLDLLKELSYKKASEDLTIALLKRGINS